MSLIQVLPNRLVKAEPRELSPEGQPATVLARASGPHSPLTSLVGTLLDLSSFGAQLNAQDKIQDRSVWIRYTPPGDVEHVVEADVLWGRAALRQGELVWVHGLKFTATLTPEMLDGLLIRDVQEAAGTSGSIFDEESPAAVQEHIGDTKVWRDDPESLMRVSAHRPAGSPAAAPPMVESFCPEPFFDVPVDHERRKSPRRIARRQGTVSLDASETGNRSIHIVTEDVSAEGVRIVADSVILTRQVTLKVENIPGLVEPVECEVRWHAETVEGLFGQHQKQTYGLAFKSPLPLPGGAHEGAETSRDSA